jgi:CSLREA domain-containing protein
MKRYTIIIASLVIAIVLMMVRPAYALTAVNILVNTPADELNQDGDCSLREAVQAANTNTFTDACAAGSASVTDVISFSIGGTITLASQLNVNAAGPLVIDGEGTITVSGGDTARVFSVNSGADLKLERVSIIKGLAENGGGIYNSGSVTLLKSVIANNSAVGNYTGGAGIYNTGTVNVIDSILASNYTYYHIGGAIYNLGQVTINNSKLGGNGAYHDGGAIYNSGTLTILDSTLDNNHVDYNGGGIYNFGTLSLVNSTLTGNSALYGGGLNNHPNGTVAIVNSTLSTNEAGYEGGGIYNQGSMTLSNSTITANHAGDIGGGLFGTGLGLSLRNTILAGNSSGSHGPDCSVMDAHSDGYNLIGNNADCMFLAAAGDKIGTSASPIHPHLGPLQDNGGPTFTHALMAGSPAIDAGNPVTPGSSGSACETTDQRGMSRPQGTRCDMGAYEFRNVTFSDVPPAYWAWSFIERLYAAGITGGCASTPLIYCPESTVTRAQMAIFLLRGIHGSSYNPPAVGSSTGFSDVPPSYWAAAWIKQLAAEGVTGGCGIGIYCPEGAVTRAQMAVFLLRSKHGASYNPPAVGSGTGFSDVPPSYWAAAWIKQLVAEGITTGCSVSNYCPEAPVTRAQMAVFLVRTFNLP